MTPRASTQWTRLRSRGWSPSPPPPLRRQTRPIMCAPTLQGGGGLASMHLPTGVSDGGSQVSSQPLMGEVYPGDRSWVESMLSNRSGPPHLQLIASCDACPPKRPTTWTTSLPISAGGRRISSICCRTCRKVDLAARARPSNVCSAKAEAGKPRGDGREQWGRYQGHECDHGRDDSRKGGHSIVRQQHVRHTVVRQRCARHETKR